MNLILHVAGGTYGSMVFTGQRGCTWVRVVDWFGEPTGLVGS